MAKHIASLASIDDSLVINPFRSVGELCEQLGLPESSYALGWRLTDYDLGAIRGLPMSRGRVAATDGIMCIIVRERLHPYIGHYNWFEVECTALGDLDVDDARLVVAHRKGKVVKPKNVINEKKHKNIQEVNDLIASL